MYRSPDQVESHLVLRKRATYASQPDGEIIRNHSENLDIELGANNRWHFGLPHLGKGGCVFYVGWTVKYLLTKWTDHGAHQCCSKNIFSFSSRHIGDFYFPAFLELGADV